MASAGRRSLADRDARSPDLFCQDTPARPCNLPNSRTTHSRSVPAAPARDRTVRCRQGSRVPKLGENREEIWPSTGELRGDKCLQRRSAAWPEGVRLLADGRSDLHCGGVNTGEALPVRPGDLVGWPWIKFDGPGAANDGAGRTSLAAVLDAFRNRTGRSVRAVVRAGSPGLTLLAAGLWLAWLPPDLLDRLPGTPLKALPLAFGRPRYRAGFVARRLGEDLEPFRILEAAVRHAALGRDG